MWDIRVICLLFILGVGWVVAGASMAEQYVDLGRFRPATAPIPQPSPLAREVRDLRRNLGL